MRRGAEAATALNVPLRAIQKGRGEPRGVEPVTSTVQRRLDKFTDVAGVRRTVRFSRFSAMIEPPWSWAFARVGVNIGGIDQGLRLLAVQQRCVP